MLVIKLGGSLYHSTELRPILNQITQLSAMTNIVIVPGGGPFADQVRQAQQQHQLSDSTSHQMALNAMKQFGLVLLDLCPQSTILGSVSPPIKPLSVWLPNDKLLNEPELAHSWDVTSDSIAIWLTKKLVAKHLLLIKSLVINSYSIKNLIETNVLDAAFSRFFSPDIDCKIVAAQEVDTLVHYQTLPSLHP